MSKAKFILLFFILLSTIYVALAETNQSTTADEGSISRMERITILSLVLVVISLLIAHYMDDHDTYAERLIEFKARYGHFKSSNNLYNYIKWKKYGKNNEKVLKDCILFHLTVMHFGSISFTLIFCFLVATLVAALLIIETISSCELNLTNADIGIVSIISIIIFILLFQLWSFLRQGNMVARWINDFKEIEFRKNCCKNYKDYPKTTFPRNKIAEWLTTKRIELSGVEVDIDGTAIIVGIWFIILLSIIYMFI